MEPEINVTDPASLILAVRDDLVFTPTEFGGQPCCLVEDPLRAKFYRVGRAEYTVLSLLDGQTSLRDAIAQSAGVLGADALTEQQAVALARWLLDCQLGSTRESSTADRLTMAARDEASRERRAWFNPLVIKAPLGSPDLLLTAAMPYVAWLATGWFLAVWLLACGGALLAMLTDWREFSAASGVILAPGNRLLLVTAWLGLKLLHETFHAVVCKRFGGSVTNAGVMFIALAPVAFVDVTSCWRLPSKWQRIFVAAAGIYGELFVAALAVLFWSAYPSGASGQLSFDVALLASVNTLLFNANPLLRFDGYYILADYLEIPNLYSSGQQYIAYLGQKHVLGQEVRLPSWPSAKARLIKIYGLAALAWRLLLYTLLSLSLVGLFGDLGGLLSALLVGYLLGAPIWKTVRRVIKQGAAPGAIATRLAVGATCGLILMLATNWLLTAPRRMTAPAIVDYRPLTVARCGASGFVRELPVRSGQWVEAGEPLAVLVNEDLLVERRQLALASEQARIKARVHQQNQALPKSQIENSNADALDNKLSELDKQLASLVVRAPVAGNFSNPRLESLHGQYLQAGAEIGVIGDEHSKELLLAVEQDDIDAIDLRSGTIVEARVSGAGQTFRAPLASLDPKASVELIHPALSARVGGAVDVKLRATRDQAETNAEPKYESLLPRFGGSVSLSSEQSLLVRAGQRGEIRFQGAAISPLARWQQSLARWIRRQVGSSL